MARRCAIPVILLEADPFVEAVAADPVGQGLRAKNIRRPLLGLTPKETRHAFVSINQANAENNLVPISLENSSAPGGKGQANHNFILQSVEEQRTEKFQIIETFGEFYTFFYGKRPTIVQCGGFLINTVDFNWKNEWIRNYDEHLRGTRCVENRARVYLGFDDVLLEGYVLTTNISYVQDMPFVCPFSFQLLVTNYVDLSRATGVVEAAEDARFLGLDGKAQLEYLSRVEVEQNWVVDPATGLSQIDSGAEEGLPSAFGAGGVSARTAFWTSDPRGPNRLWRSEDEALVMLNTELAAQEAGSDVVTARLRLRQNASEFPLGSQNDAVQILKNSLGAGVGNSAASIGDAPVLTATA